MSNSQPQNKRKRFLEEGTPRTDVAQIQQSFSNENNFPSWTTNFEHEQNRPVAGFPYQAQLQQPQLQQPQLQQPQLQQPQLQQAQLQQAQLQQPQPELSPPSQGLDLSHVFGENMMITTGGGDIGCPDDQNAWYTQIHDLPPPKDYNMQSVQFQGSYQTPLQHCSMEGSQEHSRWDQGQPGPSHRYYNPPPATHSDFNSAVDLLLPVYEDVPKEIKDRVRDENNQLLENWKDTNWQSKEWRKLEAECIEDFGGFPAPPPPAILYERKKNGRKMHSANEIDPYFHFTDKDAETLMEGKKRGNDMLKKGIEEWHKATNKQEAAKSFWKDIHSRVINNRQSTNVKNRTTKDHEHFSQKTVQVCDVANEYRSLLMSLFNGQMMLEDAREPMNEIDRRIFTNDQGHWFEGGMNLLIQVRDYAVIEANKKPTTRQRTTSKEKNNKDKKKK